ncbi:MAG: hypothetical protein J5767_14620 [Paludibacteraceae bacterium]|nr:hypothetical protein [Paludibacteraceae bacterium]
MDDLYGIVIVPSGLQSIDLGLPSGTKWANMNVGATSPEKFGSHFAWGELCEKDDYSWETYAYYEKSTGLCSDLGVCISGTIYDVAHMKWDGAWKMPSKEQVEELLQYCESMHYSLKGVEGCTFKGPNGNMIFLPAAGDLMGKGKGTRGNYGYYWTGTPNILPRRAYDNYGAYGLDLWKFNVACNINNRNLGCTIRPVEIVY